MSDELTAQIQSCRICTDRFHATETQHDPRPVAWFQSNARILIAGQAPGMKVQKSGKPFTDPSGERLRAWMGVDADTFYDKDRVAIVPMAFCFPGYRKGADLPPPAICARTWRSAVMDQLSNVQLTLLVGGHAQKWHLGGKQSVKARVEAWRDVAPNVFPLPHPSWRNTAWLNKNPWFETDLLPALKARVREVIND